MTSSNGSNTGSATGSRAHRKTRRTRTTSQQAGPSSPARASSPAPPAAKPRYLKARRFTNKAGVTRVAYYWILPPELAAAYGFESHYRLAKDLPTDANPTVLYHQACLEAEQLNAEYDRRREQAEAAPDPASVPGTLPYFIAQFRTTVAYEQLSEKTRKGTYEYGWRIVERWSALLDHIPVKRITHAHCVDLYEKLSEADPDTGERQLSRARAVIRALSRILSYAKSKGEIAHNPCYDLKLASLEQRLQIWTDADSAAFTQHAIATGRRSLALAVRLAADTGQRRADLIDLDWSAYDGERLAFVQQKTGARVRVRCTPELKAMLDATPRGTSPKVLICERTGRPYSRDFFSREIRAVADEVGLLGHWFHDLRRTAVVNLARAGATVPEITAVTGHSTQQAGKVLKHYLFPDSDQADGAIVKLQNQRALGRVESGSERMVESDDPSLANVVAFPGR
jgi:integrase